MELRFNRARPFPKFLFTFLLLAVTGVAICMVSVRQSTQQLTEWYGTLGKFVCEHDRLLIAVLLCVNLVGLIDFVIFGKRDEVINANYEYLRGRIGLRTFFAQYFAPIFTEGPYVFATEEKKSAFPRKLFNTLAGLLKFACWLIFVLVIAAGFYNPEFRAVITEGNHDYIFTLLVLFACINCDVFLWVLYRITPFYSARSYELITYYSDGTTTSRTESRNNLVAMLLLSAFVYAYFSVFYFAVFAGRLKRNAETNRLCRFLKKCCYEESMLKFYRDN